MKYVIYGAGITAKKAYDFLGFHRIACFSTSDTTKDSHGEFLDKEIISYEEMIFMSVEKTIIVIASEKYMDQMADQLNNDGVSNYFVFHEIDSQIIRGFYPVYEIWKQKEYRSFNQILSHFGISKHRNIAIYGVNYALPYLIADIDFQCGYSAVKALCMDENADDIDFRLQTIGIPIRELEEVWQEVDCVVVNCLRESSGIFDLIESKCYSFDVLYLYDYDENIPEFYNTRLLDFKDIHKGKRCFVIGNGPSLKVDDLNTLYEHGEISFAFNMIYKVFGQTKWRPTYYGISDGVVYDAIADKLDFDCKAKFLADEWHRSSDKYPCDVEFFHYNVREYFPCHPRFSDDITKGVFWGRSVVYDIGLQFAVYMGFKEIFIIGVDHNYQTTVTDKNNHFLDDYFDGVSESHKKMLDSFEFNELKATLPYESAERYARKHGIKIYNATRGGGLEVFERIDFDSIFEEKRK